MFVYEGGDGPILWCKKKIYAEHVSESFIPSLLNLMVAATAID